MNVSIILWNDSIHYSFFFFFFKFSIRELSYQLKDCNWYNLQQHQYQHTTSYPAQHLHPCNKGSFSAVHYTPLCSFYKHLSCLFCSKMTYLPLLLNLWYSKQKRWKITKIMGVFYFWFCVNSIDTIWLNFYTKNAWFIIIFNDVIYDFIQHNMAYGKKRIIF